MQYPSCLLAAVLLGPVLAQTPPDPRKTLQLLEAGNCPAGFPLAKRTYSAATVPDLKRRLGVAAVRCAMTLNQTSEAAAMIEALNRDFRADPDVLYLTVHTYSDLSLRASQTLLFAHPDSVQVHQLNAEAMETQGHWEEAEHEYRAVLEKNPQLPGIHYRIGRLILSKPPTATTAEDARREFDAELKINANNAGAEFVLGELSRQAEQWPDSIQHFTRATQLDPAFADAFIGLGRTLLAASRPAEAIAPLQAAVKLQPDNPAPHFHLGNAYRRVGRKDEADREFGLHQSTSEKARQTTENLKRAMSGDASGKPSQ